MVAVLRIVHAVIMQVYDLRTVGLLVRVDIVFHDLAECYTCFLARGRLDACRRFRTIIVDAVPHDGIRSAATERAGECVEGIHGKITVLPGAAAEPPASRHWPRGNILALQLVEEVAVAEGMPLFHVLKEAFFHEVISVFYGLLSCIQILEI
ncbi:hypothetical protein ABW21_db0209873 [Orbilia brochopaga]|nr:hypothetical protein ABW21_db0209873 [Drechslerella brochopaga]